MKGRRATVKIGQVETLLNISRMTIYRYEREGWLRIERNEETGDREFSEADLEAIRKVRQAVKDGMVEKCADIQSERIAGRKLTEQRLKRNVAELEAKLRQTESQVVTERIRQILATYPDTHNDDWELTLTYYRVFHGTENLRAAKADGAPFPDTITRRKRDILKKEATA